MDNKTWITELNAVLLGGFALAAGLGYPVPEEVIAPIVGLLNIALRIASKKGWI